MLTFNLGVVYGQHGRPTGKTFIIVEDSHGIICAASLTHSEAIALAEGIAKAADIAAHQATTNATGQAS